MPAAVTREALATPSPASSAVPRWPMIAESTRRKSGSAMRARKAGTARRTISRRWFVGSGEVGLMRGSRQRSEVLEGLASRQAGQVGVGGDERAHPLRVDAGVVAQRPADRLAAEEVRVVDVGLDDVEEERLVEVLAGTDLADDRRAPHPERVGAG